MSVSASRKASNLLRRSLGLQGQLVHGLGAGVGDVGPGSKLGGLHEELGAGHTAAAGSMPAPLSRSGWPIGSACWEAEAGGRGR